MIPTTVLYNQGARTVFYAPVDRHGRPSVVTSPTYSIVDLREADESSDRTVQASGAATIGSASTTLTAAAGPATADPRRLQVAATTNFTEGREYLVTKTDGQRESFFLARKVGTTDLYAAAELKLEFASSDTVRAFELQGTFPSAEAADETEVESGGGPYQVTWVYTVNGETYVTPQVVWLTRYSIVPLITVADLSQALGPGNRRWKDRARFEDAIALATQDYVAELEAVGKDPAYFRSPTAGRLAQRLRAMSWLHRWANTDADTARADQLDVEYRRHVDNIVNGVAPHGAVTLSPQHDDAPPGSDMGYTHSIIRRS